MITKVVVNDFQSIHKAEVDLGGSGTITTIVGPSSSGKSALLRALNLLMRNSNSVPVRAQAKSGKTSVSAQVDDKTIAVVRGKSLSEYHVNDLKYSKTGVTVPDKVREILNLYSATPDLHFAFQFDKPYLLDESGSTISNTLGTLTQASTLRGAAKEGNRRALETKRLVTTRQEDVENIKNKLEDEFSTLEDDESAYEDALKCYQEAVEASMTASKTRGVVSDVQRVTEAYKAVQSVPEKDAREWIGAAEEGMSLYLSLSSLCEDIYVAKKSVSDLPQAKNATNEISVAQDALDTLTDLSYAVLSVQQNMDKFTETKNTLESLRQALAVVQDEVSVLESQLPTCETCGQLLPEGKNHGTV